MSDVSEFSPCSAHEDPLNGFVLPVALLTRECDADETEFDLCERLNESSCLSSLQVFGSNSNAGRTIPVSANLPASLEEEKVMHQFNPLKGLAIMLAVFLVMDYVLLGGRFGREIFNGISKLF